jgi:hypothetical protein
MSMMIASSLSSTSLICTTSHHQQHWCTCVTVVRTLTRSHRKPITRRLEQHRTVLSIMGMCFECGSLKQGDTCLTCNPNATSAPSTTTTSTAAVPRRPQQPATPVNYMAASPMLVPPRPAKPGASTLPAASSPTSSQPLPPVPNRGSQPLLRQQPSPPQPTARSVPPTRQDDEDDWDKLIAASSSGAPGGAAGTPPPPVNRRTKPTYDWAAIQSNPQLQQEHYASLKVDTEGSAQALEIAKQTLMVGNSTLRELSTQAGRECSSVTNVSCLGSTTQLPLCYCRCRCRRCHRWCGKECRGDSHAARSWRTTFAIDRRSVGHDLELGVVRQAGQEHVLLTRCQR